MMITATFDPKPHEREALLAVSDSGDIEWRFLEFRLTKETALTAKGAQAVCVFVNDRVDRSCLEALAAHGVKLVALRCTGFNNVNLTAAKELGLTVIRVPVYSPYVVAEHALALLLTLNRKLHRAYNRVRELNFSLNGLVGFDLHGKTAGIVGTGKIGRIVAQILRGFEHEGARLRSVSESRVGSARWSRVRGCTHLGRFERRHFASRPIDPGNQTHYPP